MSRTLLPAADPAGTPGGCRRVTNHHEPSAAPPSSAAMAAARRMRRRSRAVVSEAVAVEGRGFARDTAADYRVPTRSIATPSGHARRTPLFQLDGDSVGGSIGGILLRVCRGAGDANVVRFRGSLVVQVQDHAVQDVLVRLPLLAR